ncbi:MATE family efflux transporter [Intestinibacter sp.]|uniref:MATE family efflux transporter n=1 Tax=Intestinibacter sp. TaxID=1965304 RepID=UPI002A758F40|nr:MATE family efflux transporter [Intestinibacter sp.]MDY2738148.1 MATE family efflux transporter [Intestinibacter sp.]MDY4574119.1 MATE family efflux transporter [Intestinibacter sp.]
MAVTQMTEGNISKKLVFFAVPVLISNLFQQLYNTVDTAIVGRFVGANALAAVGTCNLVIVFMIYFFIGLSNGSSVVLSQAFGENDNEKIFKTVHTTMGLSVISGIALMTIGLLSAETILKWINTPDDVIGYAITYIKIYFLSMIPMMVFNMGTGILRAVGDSKTPLYYLAVSGVANIILDLIFIVQFKFGVMGAALATTISQTISAVLIMIKLIKSNEIYKLHISKIRIDFDILKKILVIGIPTGLQSVLVCFSNIIVQSKVNLFGLNVMAALSIYYKVEGFIYMPIEAMAMAISNFIGQNIGAKNLERVKKGKKLSMRICVVMTVLIGGLIMLLHTPILKIFTTDEKVIYYGTQFILFIIPLYFIYAMNQILSGVLRGAGQTFIPMVIGLVCMCGLRVGWLVVMIGIVKDVRIIYASYPLTWIFTNIFMSIYYYKGKWMEKSISNENLKTV